MSDLDELEASVDREVHDPGWSKGRVSCVGCGAALGQDESVVDLDGERAETPWELRRSAVFHPDCYREVKHEVRAARNETLEDYL